MVSVDTEVLVGARAAFDVAIGYGKWLILRSWRTKKGAECRTSSDELIRQIAGSQLGLQGFGSKKDLAHDGLFG